MSRSGNRLPLHIADATTYDWMHSEIAIYHGDHRPACPGGSWGGPHIALGVHPGPQRAQSSRPPCPLQPQADWPRWPSVSWQRRPGHQTVTVHFRATSLSLLSLEGEAIARRCASLEAIDVMDGRPRIASVWRSTPMDPVTARMLIAGNACGGRVPRAERPAQTATRSVCPGGRERLREN